MAEIIQIAESLRIKPGGKDRCGLIRAIQEKEGNSPCYGTDASASCEQFDCSWRSDCFAYFSWELHNRLRSGSL